MSEYLFNPPTLDELPVGAFPDEPETIAEESDCTFEEVYAADKQTVDSRKRASTFAAAFNAVMRRAGVIRACNELKVDPNEIMRLYLTLIDAAQRTEYLAESSGAPCSKLRRFKCGMYMMELYFKRATIPPEHNEEERKRFIDTLSRTARKRWKKVHAVQRHLHLAFFVREKGEAASNKKTAGHFIDHLTDLIADTARRARGEGEPINRYNRAADEALAHFRASVAPYAPEWTPEHADADAKPDKPEKSKEGDRWKPIKSTIKKIVREALEIIREEGLSEDEAFAKRLELQTFIETEWTTPTTPKPKAARAVPPLPPHVVVNADSAKNDSVSAPPESDLDRTLKPYLNSDETANSLGKTQILSAENSAFSGLPEDQAVATVEAFESVGVEMFKAVFVGIYPLKGDAEKLGSEPKQKDVSFAAADLRARIPEYIKRNREQNCNVAVRAWGALIQVDDCNAEILERLKPFAFYAEETSPGNFQAWLALPRSYVGVDGKINSAGKGIRRRLLDKFKENGELANGGAYGSTRLPGTFNIKEKYQPDFPQIRVTHVALGRIVTPDELDRAGLLASVEKKTVLRETVARSTSSKLPTRFPDYNEFLNRKLVAGGDRADRSSADIAFACRALRLGWSKEDVISELDRRSEKAQGRKDGYSTKTVESAADWNASHPQSSGLTFSREVIVV